MAVLGVAGLAYISALALLRWLGEHEGLSQPDSLRPLMIALVLGIVTDYCIFYLSAARSRLRAGEERLDAARRATAEITPMVLASGLILAVGLAGLRISSVGFFRDLGPGLAVTVAVAVAASLLVMPAVIAIAGRALFWPRHLEAGPDADEEAVGEGRTVCHPQAGRLRDRRRLRRRPGRCGVPVDRPASGLHADPRAAVVVGQASARPRRPGLRRALRLA